MADYSLVAAIASAVAAISSALVAYFSFRQQRAAARASNIDKNVDRLIALAARANSEFSVGTAEKRSFKQVAEVVYILNSSYCKIEELEHKFSLSGDEVEDISCYFTDHLSYEIIKAMMSKRLPKFIQDDSSSFNDVHDIEITWCNLYEFFFENKKTVHTD